MTTEMTFPDIKIIPAYIDLAKEVEEAQAKGRLARPVNTESDLTTAVEILTSVEFVVRRAETVRLDMGKPYRDQAEIYSNEIKELASPLTAIVERLSGEVSAFQRQRQEEVDKERAKQEKLAARRQANEDRRAAKEGRDPITHTPPEILDPPKKIEASDGSSITTKVIRKYKVINFAELPERFKQENKGELNKAAKGGEDDIPGVEFYYDDGNQFNF